MPRITEKDKKRRYAEYGKSVRAFHVGKTYYGEAILKAAEKHGITTRTIRTAIAYNKKKKKRSC